MTTDISGTWEKPNGDRLLLTSKPGEIRLVFEKLPQGVLKFSGDLIGSLKKYAPRKNYQDYMRYAANFLTAMHKSPKLSDRYLSWMDYMKEDQKNLLYTEHMKELTKYEAAKEYLIRKLEATDAQNSVEKIISADITSYLPEDLLVKVDIATMANSLEARSPFLDHHLMEFMASVPLNFKLRGLNLKYILKKIALKRLPGNMT